MITAIVVTYNSAVFVQRCLEALDGVSTIVVDNASRDGTLNIVRERFPDVRLVSRARNGGFAVAVNEGIALAEPDDVLVLNPDVVVQPGSVDTLRAYLGDHPNVGVVAPRLVYPTGATQDSVRTFPSPLTMLARRSPLGRTRPGRALLARHLMEHETALSARPVPWALGASLYVRRDAIRDVGGMDPRMFLYGEDLDWCYRMWQHGWEVHLEPAAEMEHRYERQSRHTLDLRDAATRHHWASVIKLFVLHPTLLVGRGPSQARAAISRWSHKSAL